MSISEETISTVVLTIQIGRIALNQNSMEVNGLSLDEGEGEKRCGELTQNGLLNPSLALIAES